MSTLASQHFWVCSLTTYLTTDEEMHGGSFSGFYKKKINKNILIKIRHKHEFESGRTSSVGNDILGFSMNGEVTNKPNTHSGHLDWMDICKESAKVVTFIDLAGHEKYLKTTIFGMTGHVVCFS